MNDNDPNCGTCKDTPYMDRISVYLKSTIVGYTNEHIKALGTVMKFTEKQAHTIMDFAVKRGECLVFEGKREDAVRVVEKLTHIGVRCEARYKGALK